MKRGFLILSGGIMLLTSCENKNNKQAEIQAIIDSTVNARLAKHDAENAAKNDSILKSMEKEKAEAMSKAQLEEKNKTPPASQKHAATIAPDTLRNTN